MNAQTEVRAPALIGGGHVVAIIPQTFEETWRVAKAVLRGGLAPAALVGNKSEDDAVSAVAVAIMSGAELGLQPMVALRSFTVINGKPALYGDGLINVVRMSGRVAYLRTGCETVGGQMVGFCEAKRSDTGEEKRVEFSQDDAIRAKLWSDQPRITKRRKDGGTYEADNDSPWYRFPQRMLAWRAAGYCLRELFGDVLGGIRDEFEVREIAEVEEMRDVTPAPAKLRPPSPTATAESVVEAEVIDPTEIVEETGESVDAIVEDDGLYYGEVFENLQRDMNEAMDVESVEQVWTDYDIEALFQDDAESRELADKIKIARLTQINPLNAG